MLMNTERKVCHRSVIKASLVYKSWTGTGAELRFFFNLTLIVQQDTEVHIKEDNTSPDILQMQTYNMY